LLFFSAQVGIKFWLSKKGYFFFLDSLKWEKTAREGAFLMPKAHKTLQTRVASGKSKGAVRLSGQPQLS
jgi:hypothetical protein